MNPVPCSRCGWPVSPDAVQCPVCGQRNPSTYASNPVLAAIVQLRRTWRRLWGGLRHRLGLSQRRPVSPVTPAPGWLMLPNVSYVNAIIVACIALYVLALALGLAWTPGFTNLLTPSDIALYKLGMTGRLPVANGRWWTLITAVYLHGGLLHIAFNMLAVYQVGPLVERLFGAYRFFLIYTVSGLLGALISTLMGTHLTVGASGAIFGLMGALIYYGHRVGELPRFLPILRWAAINFLLGIVTPQVDNWGHAGGFVGGILIAMAFMVPRDRRPPYTFYGRLATMAFVATVVAFGLSLVTPIGLVR
jgi:rhomboid protease GluP